MHLSYCAKLIQNSAAKTDSTKAGDNAFNRRHECIMIDIKQRYCTQEENDCDME